MMETKTNIHSWTCEDMLEQLPVELRYEVINGELIDISPAPNSEHQQISAELGFALMGFVKEKKLGKVFFAPMDVKLDKQNVVQPDILFIVEGNLPIITRICVDGVPDLIIEIISPSSYYRDTVEKKEPYERFGVKEYWLIDPAKQVIELFTLQNGKYALHAFVAEEGKATSALLAGFEVISSDIFKPTP